MASELNVGSVATTGYVEAGTGIKLSSTNGHAYPAVKYTATGASWTDVLTIGWANGSWAHATIQMNLVSDNAGGALEVNVVKGHAGSSGSTTYTGRLGNDLSAQYQWVHSMRTSKLQLQPADTDNGGIEAIITVNIGRRPDNTTNLTWH